MSPWTYRALSAARLKMTNGVPGLREKPTIAIRSTHQAGLVLACGLSIENASAGHCRGFTFTYSGRYWKSFPGLDAHICGVTSKEKSTEPPVSCAEPRTWKWPVCASIVSQSSVPPDCDSAF